MNGAMSASTPEQVIRYALIAAEYPESEGMRDIGLDAHRALDELCAQLEAASFEGQTQAATTDPDPAGRAGAPPEQPDDHWVAYWFLSLRSLLKETKAMLESGDSEAALRIITLTLADKRPMPEECVCGHSIYVHGPDDGPYACRMETCRCRMFTRAAAVLDPTAHTPPQGFDSAASRAPDGDHVPKFDPRPPRLAVERRWSPTTGWCIALRWLRLIMRGFRAELGQALNDAEAARQEAHRLNEEAHRGKETA